MNTNSAAAVRSHAAFDASRMAIRSGFDRNDAIEEIISLGRARVIAPGTAIHRAGDPFRSVFYVRSGP
jgi:hypothetical protein